MPEKPIPEDDPIVSKSLAPHYVVAMLVLMATLFWALWDEDFGQRPWKAFQHEWKDSLLGVSEERAFAIECFARKMSRAVPNIKR